MNIPFEKSFASHEKAKYWSDKNEVKPFQISKGTDEKYWFNCNVCSHEFLIQLNIVSRGGWIILPMLSYKFSLKGIENRLVLYEKAMAFKLSITSKN